MWKKIICLLLIFFVVGCGEVAQRTQKEKLQDKIMHEFDNCENKFQTQEKKVLYCMELMSLIERQIDEGWWDDSEETTITITDANEKIEGMINKTRVDESVTEVLDAVDRIIGEI